MAEEKESKMRVSIKIPKDPGACADLLYRQREARLFVTAQTKQFKFNESALKDYMLNTFEKSDLTGVRGKLASVAIDYEYYPSLTDATKFFEWVAKNKRWDLLYKQVNADAWREMHLKKKAVPGVEPYRDVKFSVTKIAAPKKARLADTRRAK